MKQYFPLLLSLSQLFASARPSANLDRINPHYLEIVEINDFLKKNPFDLQAYADLYYAYREMGEIETAQRIYFKALAMNPDFIDVIDGKQIGSWSIEQAWSVNGKPIQKKAWNGESLDGKIILVYCHCENQYTIQYARFLKMLTKMGAEVFFLPPKELEILMRQSLQEVVTVLHPDTDIDGILFDTHASLLSLPYYLNIYLEDISSSPYLFSDKERVKQYKEWFFQTDSLKVGLYGYNDLIETLPPNVSVYSLDGSSKKAKNLAAFAKNHADLAAILENFDLIISEDPSITHLSAALGLTTWSKNLYDDFWYDTLEYKESFSEKDFNSQIHE